MGTCDPEVEQVQVQGLYLGQGSPFHQYRLEDEGIESSPVEQDLRALLDENLVMSWQCALISQKASGILRIVEVIMLSCFTLVRLCLEYCILLWSP